MITLAFCWCFPPELTPEDGLPRLAAAGFEAIELWPEPLARFGARRWAAALAANGMGCAQLCPYFNVVSGPAGLVGSLAQLAGFIAAAEVLACRRLRVFTGPPWGDGVVGPRQATPDQWKAAGEHLRRFCDLAAPHGLELCLECHVGSLMEDSPSTERLLSLVNRANLTVNLQLPLVDETWQTSVDRLGAHTTHIHIHDYLEHIGGIPTFLGAGVFPWHEALRRLLTHGRDLTLSVEHADHQGRDDLWETVRRDGPWLQAIRRTLT